MSSVIQVLISFLGSLGFALVYNLHGKKLWVAGLGGLVSWTVYLVLQQVLDNNFLMFMYAAIAATVYSEVMARLLKTPATVYLISAIIPLVPGGNLYYAMNYAIAKDWSLFSFYGQKTISIATAVAGGIMMASSVFTVYKKVIKKPVKE